jgi:hypothetical protein
MNSEEIRQKYSAENVLQTIREGHIILVEDDCDEKVLPQMHRDYEEIPRPPSPCNASEEIVLVYPPNSVSGEICRQAANRCFVQNRLYEIYFEPDGISYKDSKLQKLLEDRDITEDWYLRDHNEAVKLIKLFKGNMEECKVFVKQMNLHQGYIFRLERWRKCYNQIIAYYETTGFLEELDTDI